MNHFDFTEVIRSKTDSELYVLYKEKDKYQSAFVALLTEEFVKRHLQIPEELQAEVIQQKDSGMAANIIGIICILVLGSFIIVGGTSLLTCFSILIPTYIYGYQYAYGKKTVSGHMHYKYDDHSRYWGKITLLIGIGLFSLALLSLATR